MQVNSSFEFYDVINKYLKTDLNSQDNCLYVKFKGDEPKTAAYEIGVKSLATRGNPYESYKKQIVFLNAFVESLETGSPAPSKDCSDLFLYKILALCKSVVESIFFISLGEKAQLIAGAKVESDYRSIFINALKEHVACFEKKYQYNQIPRLSLASIQTSQLSSSEPSIVKISSRKVSRESLKGDIKSSEFFEKPLQKLNMISEFSSSDEKKFKSPLFESKSQPSIEKKTTSPRAKRNNFKRRSSSLSKIIENKIIPDDDLKYKIESARRNISGLSQLELDFCKHVAFKKLLNPQMLLKKIEREKEFQEFKISIDMQTKSRFNSVINLDLCESSLIKYFLEEEVSRMLKKITSSSASFAADIDRHIENLTINSYYQNENNERQMLTILSPKISKSSNSLENKVKLFYKMLKHIVEKLIEERNLFNKIGCPVNESKSGFKAILEKWKKIVHEILETDFEDPFVSICTNFLNYLSMQNEDESFCESDIESYRTRNKVLKLLWLLNQETYTMPLISILKAFPGGPLATKAGSIQLHFFSTGRIKAIAKASLVPAESSQLENFKIIVSNLMSSSITNIPTYTSQVSVEIENVEVVPNFIKNALHSMGFTYARKYSS